MISQMNMFKKKGPNPQEVIRETNLKRNISKEFSRIVKVLQQRHMNADGPIYSDDEANALCNILEAVFLHGLKDSIATKIVSYVNFSSQNQDTKANISFWEFVSKFTHKDVIGQLRQLPQITTDIGHCRAWIRLALNDGLMESYLHSVIADSRTLQYYYHTTAYLRDHEHPGILKSYLSGLMNLTFKLSFNSSVLNDWTSTPLVLSGIVDAQTPTPIFKVGTGVEKPKTPSNKTSLSPPPRTSRSRSHDRSCGDNSIIANSNSSVGEMPSYGVQGFTRADMEAIKNVTGVASSPYTASECSSSSHISCPDPSGAGFPSLDPSLIENQILREIMAQNDADLIKARDGLIVRSSPKEDRKTTNFHDKKIRRDRPIERSPLVKKKEFSSQEKPESVNSRTEVLSPGNEKELTVPQVCEEDVNSVSCDTLVDCVTQDVIENISETVETSSTTNENITEKETIMSVYNSDSKTDNSFDEYIDTSVNKNKSDLPPLEKPSELSPIDRNSELPPFGHQTPPVSPYRRKSDAVEPALSTVVAAIEVPNERRLSINALHEFIAKRDGEGNHGNREGIYGSPRSLGNKLGVGAMSGWSSEFEQSGEHSGYLSEVNLARLESSTEEEQRRVAARTESFRTLLKNYAPPNSGASLDEVIENLPRSSVSDLVPVVDNAQPPQLMKTDSSEELVVAGFEIVDTNLPLSKCDSPSNPNSRLFHYQTIAVERGLDTQNYQCKGCTRPVGLIYGNPRVCMFDGGYYCFECHENDEISIPAYVVYNWDFRKQRVSRENLAYVQDMEEQPVLDMEQLNPKIYEHVPEVEEVRVLRQQLCSLKTYLFSCHHSVAEDLRKKVWPREHMYDNRHLYSMADLVQVSTGQLSRQLKEVVKFATRHVYDCSLCCQKGFICEVCNNQKVIYPFEVHSTYRCLLCKAVYHKTCMTENLPCPKCTRWRLRKTSFGGSPHDSEDYAFTPP